MFITCISNRNPTVCFVVCLFYNVALLFLLNWQYKLTVHSDSQPTLIIFFSLKLNSKRKTNFTILIHGSIRNGKWQS